jgi:hypothetical protein
MEKQTALIKGICLSPGVVLLFFRERLEVKRNILLLSFQICGQGGNSLWHLVAPPARRHYQDQVA